MSSEHALPERRNTCSTEIDALPTIEVLRVINAEDERVPRAVARALPKVATLVDVAVAALLDGHRVHYFGAGTSGRLAVIDAAELPPTYGIARDRVVPHYAGGLRALAAPALAEDDDPGAADSDDGMGAMGGLDAAEVAGGDVTIGVAVNGRSRYVAGALQVSAARGAYVGLISGSAAAPPGVPIGTHIALETGPEVIGGTPPMKAGTAAKLVLNAFSTATMVRLGHTYSNLMIGVAKTNAKLRRRVVRILIEATGLPAAECERALAEADGDTRTALVALLGEVPPGRATMALRAGRGSVREALRWLHAADERPCSAPGAQAASG
ncbi:MAG TPA: N-acetylmuramic acid 6-phosphate etherase [Streptosporangiaceae bacterium]|nr:N-acetylmuramic acid 6-phosphate etherase [Gaiellales bacterium]